MNKIFRARIRWYQYLFIVLLGALSLFFLWDKQAIWAALCMILLVFMIERFIHTTYTITVDGKLILHSGRFSGSRTVWIKDIASVERRSSVKIAGLSLLRYVIVGLNTGHYISLLPQKEEEFVNLLREKRGGMVI